MRVLRAHRDLPLQQLADQGGVSNAHISLIQRGKRSMSAELLKKLARALDADVDMDVELLLSQPATARGAEPQASAKSVKARSTGYPAPVVPCVSPPLWWPRPR